MIAMSWWNSVVLGAVEGLTEFLPISSTGHLTIVEKWMGFKVDDDGITAFTAIIQIGAILAVMLYLRTDVKNIVRGWVRGVFRPEYRTDPYYRFGWLVILGSIPIGIVGVAFQHQIETTLRSLWLVGSALIVFSGVLWLADRLAVQRRGESEIGARDVVFVGVAQCLALIPGVSRSGATMSAGLVRGFDRVTVTRLSFFLSIPALVAAGALEVATKHDDISHGVGWGRTLVATAVSFVVGYVAVAWLLRFISRHTFNAFVLYRVALGVAVLALVGAGALAAT